MSIWGYWASTQNPAKKVSAVSSKGWCEELCGVDDVTIGNFSGCGIGFPQHKRAGVYQPALLNGARFTNFVIVGAMYRTTMPMYFTIHANNVVVESGTIAMTFDEATANAGYTWPEYGIHAQGTNLRISNVHFESCRAAIVVPVGMATNTVEVHNVDAIHMIDRKQRHTFDGLNTAGSRVPPPAGSSDADYATLVWVPADNHRDVVTVSSLVSHGGLSWLYVDDRINCRVSTFGQSQFPEYPYGRLAFHSRTNTWERGPRTSTLGPIQ
jgi:hypothetical protein